MPKRLAVLFAFAPVAAAPSSPTLGDVLLRMRAYLESYEGRLSTVVAREKIEARASVDCPDRRRLRSDGAGDHPGAIPQTGRSSRPFST
jgi:hypothetical protein